MILVNRSRASRLTISALALVLLAASGTQARAQDSSAVRITPSGLLVDFQDADLRVVIAALAEAGGLNVAYGEIPPRRVTLHLRQTIARTDVVPLLRSLAQSNGLRLVEDGGITRLEAVDPRSLAPNAANGAGRAGAAPAGEVRLFVYRLRHARAARMASTLMSVFGGRAMGAPEVTGLSDRPLSEQLRSQQVQPLGSETPPSAGAAPAARVSLPGALQAEVQIVPDESTNSLLIRAQPADFEVVRQAVEAMDLRPLQVLIEVLIAEVRHSNELEVGVTAKGTYKSNDTDRASGELKSSTTSDFVLRLTRGGRIDVDVALAALATRGDVRVLSRPLVLAQNNLEAKILVGSQRPFVQVFRSLPTDAAVRDQVVQYRDVGTSLAILPTINPDGYVTLQVSQEVSSATAETQFGAPVISTREASTHLFVRDGQTAVLGGLIDRQSERTRSGIPVLSAIPGVGALFGSTRNSTTTSELFLFLTPYIVSEDEDIDHLREEIERRSPGLREDVRRRNPPLEPGRDSGSSASSGTGSAATARPRPTP